MVGVIIDKRGLVQQKGAGEGTTITIQAPVSFTAGQAVTADGLLTANAAITVVSGAVTVSNGATIHVKVSSSLASSKPNTSGLLQLGGVPPTTLLQNVLLQISASANQSGQNAIAMWSTGSGVGGGQGDGQGGVVNGSGGNLGVHATPPAGSLVLYTDGVRLYAKSNNSAVQWTFLATSSTGLTL